MGDVIADFIAITGASEENAINYLSSTDFNLTDAVNLFHAAHEGGTSQQEPPRPAPTQPQSSHNHQHVSRLFDEGPAPAIPDALQLMMQMQAAARGRGRGQGYHQRDDDEFNLFQRDQPRGRVEELPDDDDYQGVNLNEEDDVGYTPPVRQPVDSMQHLFRKPNYTYRGSFAECCETAVRTDRWVILNILVQGNFPSGCLNRDIWLNDIIRDVIPPSFFLFQCHSNSEEGSVLANEYRIPKNKLPCIWIIDPLTRAVKLPLNVARISQANGTFSVQAFLDEITTFLEANPGHFRRMPTSSSVEDLSPHKQRDDEVSYETTAKPDFTSTGDEAVYADDDAMLAAVLKASEESARQEQKLRETQTSDASSLASTTRSPALKQAKVEVEKTTTPPSAPVLTSQAVVTSPAPSPAPVSPDVSAFIGGSGANTFKLRFRLPHGSSDIVVSGDIPVALLIQHVAYQIFTANSTAFPTPPNIELRGGFPPKPLAVPNDTITLAEWGCLRQNDNVLVHIL